MGTRRGVGGEQLSIRAGLLLYGEDLRVRKDSCIWIREGIVESVETSSTCDRRSIGGPSIIVVPQPSNSHVHSADHAFTEYGLEMGLEELVSYPKGLKHRLLEKARPEDLVRAIRDYYLLAWRYGLGAVSDFREGGGQGCILAKKAAVTIPEGTNIVVLGRPGPLWPSRCDGLGVSSPLDYSIEELVREASRFDITAAHIAESEEARRKGDLELAMEAGIRIAVHGIFLDYSDLLAMKEKSMGLVACVRSNMWHGAGIPPIRDIIETDVSLGLGTDNASWNTPDIWEEARAFLLAGRYQGVKEEKLVSKTLSALFIEGYKMLGLKPRILKEGEPSRLLMVADMGAGLLNSVNPRAAIIKRTGAGNIVARIDDGKVTCLSKIAPTNMC